MPGVTASDTGQKGTFAMSAYNIAGHNRKTYQHAPVRARIFRTSFVGMRGPGWIYAGKPRRPIPVWRAFARHAAQEACDVG